MRGENELRAAQRSTHCLGVDVAPADVAGGHTQSLQIHKPQMFAF